MITYWLVVMLALEGEWMTFENIKLTSRQECEKEMALRLSKLEAGTYFPHLITQEHEFAVSCNLHWSEEKAL